MHDPGIAVQVPPFRQGAVAHGSETGKKKEKKKTHKKSIVHSCNMLYTITNKSWTLIQYTSIQYVLHFHCRGVSGEIAILAISIQKWKTIWPVDHSQPGPKGAFEMLGGHFISFSHENVKFLNLHNFSTWLLNYNVQVLWNINIYSKKCEWK